MLKDSLRISRDLGELLTIAVDLGRFASVLAAEGKAAMAARLLSSSEALTEERGASVVWWAGRRNEETLATIRTHLDEAALAEAWEQGQGLTADEAVALALDSSG